MQHLKYCQHVPGTQTTPASCWWPQLLIATLLFTQSNSLDSTPIHLRLSSKMIPVPWPNAALVCSMAPKLENPNCLQVTAASARLHMLLHTVPHTPSKHTSTWPCWGWLPPDNLISPVLQPIIVYNAIISPYLQTKITKCTCSHLANDSCIFTVTAISDSTRSAVH